MYHHQWICVLAAWTYEVGGHPGEGGRPPVRPPTSINSAFVRKNISMGSAVKESDKLLRGSTSKPPHCFSEWPKWKVFICGCI